MAKGPEYTNTRASKVSACGVDFLPGETKEIDPKHAEALEKKGDDGKHVHPLRKGHAPVLRPGKVAMPDPVVVAPVNTLDGLDLVKALAQIRLCQDLNILAGWHAAEKRPDLLAAIDARGKELTAAKG